MKVQAENVSEFLDKVKALVEGIKFTAQCGDDGLEESVMDQADVISKVIEVFKLENLTPLTMIEPAAKKYSRIYEALSDKQDRTFGESQDLYRSELYFAVKRLVKDDSGISECKNDQLALYIESLVPTTSKYNKLIYSDQFFYTSMKVIQEVADEIIEQRAKAPQTKLF